MFRRFSVDTFPFSDDIVQLYSVNFALWGRREKGIWARVTESSLFSSDIDARRWSWIS